VAMSVLAAPLMRYTDAAALQLTDRAAYARAVLPEMGGDAAQTTRPYTGQRPAAVTAAQAASAASVAGAASAAPAATGASR
jgi:multicomponent K+:H+ antiporter subunit D